MGNPEHSKNYEDEVAPQLYVDWIVKGVGDDIESYRVRYGESIIFIAPDGQVVDAPLLSEEEKALVSGRFLKFKNSQEWQKGIARAHQKMADWEVAHPDEPDN